MASLPALHQQLNPHRTLVSRMQAEVHVARRSAHALRAVQTLSCAERFSEGEEVQYLRRDDLAQLIEIIQSDLFDRLDALETYIESLPDGL